MRGWKYALVALADAEANFLVVKAYQFTSLTSVQVAFSSIKPQHDLWPRKGEGTGTLRTIPRDCVPFHLHLPSSPHLSQRTRSVLDNKEMGFIYLQNNFPSGRAIESVIGQSLLSKKLMSAAQLHAPLIVPMNENEMVPK